MMKKLLPLVVVALIAGALPAHAVSKGRPPAKKMICRDNFDAVFGLELPVDGEKATGRIAMPKKAPKTLVVFAHGYSHHSASWIEHMRKAAAEHGVLAVAMDYRGTYEEVADDGTVSVRGWFVKEGAQDMIAVTQLLRKLCPSIKETVLFGVSMGGNASGLALAASSQHFAETSQPLFDYWFDVEGAVNVVETYLGASALASANTFAANAKADIEDEMNATFEEDPEGYQDLAVVSHIDEIAASGVKGVAIIHAMEDGLVPYNQAREIAGQLLSKQIPTEFYTMGTKGDGEGGTTITSYSPFKDSPLAGHASETSTTHVVMVQAFERLWALIDEGVGFSGYSEHHSDGGP